MVVFSPARPARAPPPEQLARVGELAVGSAHAGDDLARRRIDDVADRVDGDDRRHDEPVGHPDRRRSDAGFHRSAVAAAAAGLADGRAGAGADVAFLHRRFAGGPAAL